MIRFENVSKEFKVGQKCLKALRPINLAIKQGEIFGLIGRSGAGKSTLIRMINRLEDPTTGTVTVDGEDVTSMSPHQLRVFRSKVGMIFQHFNLLSSKTVAENIALPLEIGKVLKPDEIAERVRYLLDKVELTAHANKYPAQLSGGQKQRVGIARALSTKPKILLCDEATSALDPETTIQVLSLLRAINEELNLTIVLITHEMEVIRNICDRVAVIADGEIVEQGLVTDVFLLPQHEITKRFVLQSEGETEDDVSTSLQAMPGRILRLTFRGSQCFAPILSQMSAETGIQFSILAGRIDRIKTMPYGQLTLGLSSEEAKQAEEFLSCAEVHVEVLK